MLVFVDEEEENDEEDDDTDVWEDDEDDDLPTQLALVGKRRQKESQPGNKGFVSITLSPTAEFNRSKKQITYENQSVLWPRPLMPEELRHTKRI